MQERSLAEPCPTACGSTWADPRPRAVQKEHALKRVVEDDTDNHGMLVVGVGCMRVRGGGEDEEEDDEDEEGEAEGAKERQGDGEEDSEDRDDRESPSKMVVSNDSTRSGSAEKRTDKTVDIIMTSPEPPASKRRVAATSRSDKAGINLDMSDSDHARCSPSTAALVGRRRDARRNHHLWLRCEDAVRARDDELRVPDHIESIKEAVLQALDCQTIYVRAGEHRWRGQLVFPRNQSSFVRGELGSRLWGQWQRRALQPRAGVDNYCVSLPFGSQGSLGSLVLAHETLGSFDACLCVTGGPWLIGQCKVLSSHATAMLARATADVLMRRCSLGGLEPAVCVDTQVGQSRRDPRHARGLGRALRR
jgi:hypothetical protein